MNILLPYGLSHVAALFLIVSAWNHSTAGIIISATCVIMGLFVMLAQSHHVQIMMRGNSK